MAHPGTTIVVSRLCSGVPDTPATSNTCRLKRWTSHRLWQRWSECRIRLLTDAASTSTAAPTIPARLLRLLFDEGVDVACEDDHGHVAALHERIVKQAQVEFVSQIGARLGAQAVDLAVANFVTARLPRPRTVTVDLAGHLFQTRSVGGCKPLDRLLARPAF